MKTLQHHYSVGLAARSEFEERGIRSSVLTIPAVFRRDETGRDRLPQNYQSVGAEGVNTLASKLGLSLFPTQLPFYRLAIDPFMERQLVSEFGVEDAAAGRAEIEKNLALIEETGREAFETQGWRPVMSECLRHLLITGNGLIMVDKKRGPQFVDLHKYICERDPEGNIIKVVVKQHVAREIAARYFPDGLPEDATRSSEGDKNLALYSGACLEDNGQFKYWQEVEGVAVPGSLRMLPAKRLPLIPLRFNGISGASYGSSFVEEYDGDLIALEALSRSITEAALAAAKLLILVKPGASIRAQTIATSPNGAVKQGNIDDVGVLQMNKALDLSVAQQRAMQIEQRLMRVFLMANQRDAERVTAQEVRSTIQEIEDALGGVYSSLAENVQKPIIHYILSQITDRPDVPKLPKGIEPIIATGLEAISRGHEANRLLTMGQISQQLLGPQEAAQYFNPRAILTRVATSLNLDSDAIIKSEEQIQQELEMAQQQQALSSVAGPAGQVLAAQVRQQPQQ